MGFKLQAKQALACLFVFFVSHAMSLSLTPSAKEDAGVCKRIRRPVHMLTEAELDLVLEGMLAIRDIDDADDIMNDQWYAIASTHSYGTYVHAVHQSSANMFWHGYLLWEIESRVRALGGKFACFAMPYYDMTTDYEKELDPGILKYRQLGGNGDPDNGYSVNGYSWDVSVEEWFVPGNCDAKTDVTPYCSLKRKLTTDPNDVGEFIPSTAQILARSAQNPIFNNFEYFAKMSEYQSLPLMFMLGGGANRLNSATGEGSFQGFEPIWWMFHSFVTMQASLWITCHGYEDKTQLFDNSDAYTSYCGGILTDFEPDDCKHSEYLRERPDTDQFDFDFGLDNALKFPFLEDYGWAYSHTHRLSVRDLWDISDWNAVYDFGTLYESLHIDEYCPRSLDSGWFITTEQERLQELMVDGYVHKSQSPGIRYDIVTVAILFLFVLVYVCYRYGYGKQKPFRGVSFPLDGLDATGYGAIRE